jgi:hypothetical protein
MIPERDHPLNESWSIDPDFRNTLGKCLSRQVQITVKGTTNMIKLLPVLFGQVFESNKTLTQERTLGTAFRLKAVVYWSNVLRASSDVTRVRVRRMDPLSKQAREWTFDLTRVMEPHERDPAKIAFDQDLWLRDGDVIEIPEKRDGFGTEATANSGPLFSPPAIPRSPRPLPPPDSSK